MRTSLPLALGLILAAAPASAQLVSGGAPGVPAGAGGTSAAFGGGTMGPYSGSVPGGASAATAGGTMGPTAGGGIPGIATGSGYQLGAFTATPTIPGNNPAFSSGLNAGSLGSFNAGSFSLAGSTFGNQSPMQPLRFNAPSVGYVVPSLAPSTVGIPGVTTTQFDSFSTVPSTGFALPVAGANTSGTIRNSAGTTNSAVTGF